MTLAHDRGFFSITATAFMAPFPFAAAFVMLSLVSLARFDRHTAALAVIGLLGREHRARFGFGILTPRSGR